MLVFFSRGTKIHAEVPPPDFRTTVALFLPESQTSLKLPLSMSDCIGISHVQGPIFKDLT